MAARMSSGWQTASPLPHRASGRCLALRPVTVAATASGLSSLPEAWLAWLRERPRPDATKSLASRNTDRAKLTNREVDYSPASSCCPISSPIPVTPSRSRNACAVYPMTVASVRARTVADRGM